MTMESPIIQMSAIKHEKSSSNHEHAHYSNEEIDKWKKGAEQYRLFEKDIGNAMPRLNKSIMETMKAVFLSEKPAIIGVWQPYHAVFNELKRYGRMLQISPEILSETLDPVKQIIDIILNGQLDEATTIEAIGPLAKKYGFVCTPKFIYHPDLVKKTITAHPEAFAKHNLKTPEEVMSFLETNEPPIYYEVMGLVLGYPDSAVKFFCERHAIEADEIRKRLIKLLKDSPDESEFLSNSFLSLGLQEDVNDLMAYFKEKLFQFQHELNLDDAGIDEALHWIELELSAHPYEASGTIWVDRKDSKESIEKQKRLNDALRLTGLAN